MAKVMMISSILWLKKKVLKKGLFNYGQDIIMAFLPPVVGCLVKKGLQKGGSWAPQDPPRYTYESLIPFIKFSGAHTSPVLAYFAR